MNPERQQPLVLVFFVGLILSACTAPAPSGGGDILVMGDSVMAWNGTSGRAIPDALATSLNRTVISRAVPGAQFDNDSGVASAIGFEIRSQYPGGRWNWVVLNGGANDLSADCDCGKCGPVVDGLIGADATSGAIPAFLRRMRGTGAKVLWMGYYAGNGKGSFEGCRDDLVALEARLARFAARTDGVFFADSEDVIDRLDPANFAADNTHPSPKASATIGGYLATVIQRNDRQ